jgi:hypothetical protein
MNCNYEEFHISPFTGKGVVPRGREEKMEKCKYLCGGDGGGGLWGGGEGCLFVTGYANLFGAQ